MRHIKGTLDFYEKQNCVVTLGKFDGIHRGHQALIDRVLAYEEKQVVPTVFAFASSPVGLLSKKERRQMLKKRGIELFIECPFVADLISMTPEIFVRRMLVEQLHTVHVVVGSDFRFGYKRIGNVELLRRLGEKYGFSVEVVDEIFDDDRKISSTYIRDELGRGNIEKVNELLGYEYYITGEVVHGRQVGRTIGIPTTNLIPPREKLLPPNGVYVTQTTISGRIFAGMTDIGCKPTVEGSFVGVETYLFGCEENLYGKKEKVKVQHFVRPEIRFESLEILKNQLKRDEETIKKWLKQQNAKNS